MFESGPFLNPAQLDYHGVKCGGKLYKPGYDTQYNKGVGGGITVWNSYDEALLKP